MKSLLPFFIKITGQNLILPFYHAVEPEPSVHLKPLYRVRTPQQFRNDCDLLLAYYKPLAINELKELVETGNPDKRNSFFLSFDDGLRSFATYAWPILKEKGIPVHLFINPSFISNQKMLFRFSAALIVNRLKTASYNYKELDSFEKLLFNSNTDSLLIKNEEKNYRSRTNALVNAVLQVRYHESEILYKLAGIMDLDLSKYMKEESPYLTLDELKQLEAEGVTIGAHSLDHPLFNQLDTKVQMQQIIDSVAFVMENFNSNIKSFSFPFTDYGLSNGFISDLYRKQILELGFGTAGIKHDVNPYQLQRIPIESYKGNLDTILSTQYLKYMMKSIVGKNLIIR